jgi:hypothetical protein
VTDGQIELADQTARAEGGKSFSQFHELSLGGKRSFLRLMMASAGPSQEFGGACCWKRRSHLRTVGTVVAHSRAVGLMPRCLAPPDASDGCKWLVASHAPDRNSGQRSWDRDSSDTRRNRDRAVSFIISAPTFPAPCAVSRLHTSTPPGGYDVSRLFHVHLSLDIKSDTC